MMFKIVELLNAAQISSGDGDKIESLKIVQEIVLHKVRFFYIKKALFFYLFKISI